MTSKLAGAFVVLTLLSASAATTKSQETPKASSDKVTPIDKSERVRNEGVYAGLKKVDAGSNPNEIRCRGGRNKLIFTAENSKLGSTGDTIIITLLTFEPSAYPAGPRGEGLYPGECSWVDRPMNERFLIRFETPSNAQLKQTLHGSALDTSPTAAERYPDSRTIPVYMNDSSHYWSFIGKGPVNNFFVATGNGYFKPPVRLTGTPQNPDGFKQRKRVVVP